ncbi:MAG TPA: Wzz/FepE/Etk N-terminal domain-containing protein [Ignavibacteriaceae bacterium]|nr:Wzz/FepE/Etk N-terminal domain-containing protein [Ignavibacteriaceae bacterium]
MSFHDILNIILFNRVKILKITILTSIFLFIILLFLYPRTYSSPATILPPENKSQMGSLSSLIGGQDFSGLLSGSFTNANSQLFAEILKSRSVAEYVVKKHNLVEYFDAENEIEAAKEISKKLKVDINKEGILKVSVGVSTSFIPMLFDEVDTVKQFVADLSNSFVEALDKINREKLSSRAKRTREYIEAELITTKVKMDSVENALVEFQKKNKTVALPEQVSAVIDAAAKIKTEIMKTEIEIGLLKSNLTEESKELQSLRQKLSQLQQQYNRFELGNQDYLLAFKEVPELGKELTSLLREIKIQNEVYTLLQQQYYKEKIQENRDLPTVEVLDKAIFPLKADSPRILFSTFFGGIFVFMLISLFFLVMERKNYLLKNFIKSETKKDV